MNKHQKKRNNKGFTLIEVLAVIVLLGIVLAIGGYSISSYLSNSRAKSLDIFKKNIKSGMINYYNECKYMSTSACDGINITIKTNTNVASTTIGDLVDYGFLEDTSSESGDGVTNPIDKNEELTSCIISITYYTDKYSEEDKRQTFSEVDFKGNKCGSLKTN